MFIDPIYFPVVAALIGLSGVAIGTLLSELRTVLENRRNSKRILKVALYHQFQLFGEMLAFDKETAEQFARAMEKSLIEIGIPREATSVVFGALPPELFELMHKAKDERILEVVDRHEETMRKLAEVDPLFAMSWSHKAQSAFPKQLGAFLEGVSGAAENNEIVTDFVIHISRWYERRSEQRLLESFEKGLIRIAWRIGPLTWIKVKRDLKQWRARAAEEVESESQAYIHEIVNYVLLNHERINEKLAFGNHANSAEHALKPEK